MANFQNNAITENGILLRSHVDMGAVFTATRIVMGSGYIPAGKTAKTMTAVVNPVKELTINKKERTPDGKVVFGGIYTNEGVTTDFYFRELALYAKAVYPNGTEIAEVLYCYGNAAGSAELMAAYSTSTVVERQMDIVTFVGNDAQIDLTIESGVFVTREQVEAMLDGIGSGPHASTHSIGGDDPITPAMIGAIAEAAPFTADANTQLVAGGGKAFLNAFDQNTLNTPYKAGQTAYASGLIITYAYTDQYAVQMCLPAGADDVFVRRVSRNDGIGTWREYAAIDEVVKKSGDTMTGPLYLGRLIMENEEFEAQIVPNGSSKELMLNAYDGSRGVESGLCIRVGNVIFYNETGEEYRLIHEGNMNEILGVSPASIE